MSATDALLAAPILAGALWLLYRSLFAGRGACHGCSGSCGAPRRDRAGLVRLGAPRRPPGPGPG